LSLILATDLEYLLRRAHKEAHALPMETFGSEPYLKLSGISVVLAEVLEANNKPREAYEVLLESLQTIRDATVRSRKQASTPDAAGSPTPRERMRAVALASKLGSMAETYQLPSAEEERFLVFAVQEMLRVVREVQATVGVSSLFNFFNTAESPSGSKGTEDEKLVLSDLQLPRWVTKVDVGAPIEALGTFYSKTGRLE
jgi:hypothetical protein